MNDAFPIDVSPGFISITNPFDGVEVGTVANIPPEGAQMLIQTARDGARVCRNLPRHERARLHETCASLASFSLSRTPPWRCITLPMATCSKRGVVAEGPSAELRNEDALQNAHLGAVL